MFTTVDIIVIINHLIALADSLITPNLILMMMEQKERIIPQQVNQQKEQPQTVDVRLFIQIEIRFSQPKVRKTNRISFFRRLKKYGQTQ